MTGLARVCASGGYATERHDIHGGGYIVLQILRWPGGRLTSLPDR
jgi:hypothetical protein